VAESLAPRVLRDKRRQTSPPPFTHISAIQHRTHVLHPSERVKGRATDQRDCNHNHPTESCTPKNRSFHASKQITRNSLPASVDMRTWMASAVALLLGYCLCF
ncbi:hypothetical protein BaRGS_00024503, partial [Batillaria attramentaria]